MQHTAGQCTKHTAQLPLHTAPYDCCWCHCCCCQVAGGLLDEALLLLQLGLAPNSHVATKAIGYRQACEFMQVGEIACILQ